MNERVWMAPSRALRSTRPLCGLRIAILEGCVVNAVRLERLYEGFELAGAEVRVVAPELDLEHDDDDVPLRADERLSSSAPERYHALCIPGSARATNELRQSRSALQLVAAFANSGKPITALDHAALLLMSAVGVAGRTLTSDPTLEEELTNAGATWLAEPTVVDRTWLTADGSRLAAALQLAVTRSRSKSIEPPPTFATPRAAARF